MSWLREKEVNILEYLPEFLPSDKEFKNLSDTLSKEHETIREDLHYLLAEVIITTDSSYGLSLWEAALELSPAAGATDEERRRECLEHSFYDGAGEAILHTGNIGENRRA